MLPVAHALDVFAPLCRRVHIVSGRSSASVARCDGRRPAESEVVEFGNLFGAQGDGAGRYVLLDPGYPFGARYRRDLVALGEEPGQCDLRRRGTGFGGDGMKFVGDVQVAFEVVTHEAGLVFRQSLSSRSSIDRMCPVRTPWPSGE